MTSENKQRESIRIRTQRATRCLFFLVLLFGISSLYAQKQNFVNFNVENGLAQSQTTVFAQNRNNELLIGTFGGLSVFDGSFFVNYNKSKGLPNNVITALATDRNKNTWIGTNDGIAFFNGQQFHTYYPSSKAGENVIRKIIVDRYNNVWTIVNDKLYRFSGSRFVRDTTIGTTLSITLDKSEKAWVVNPGKGIFVWNGQGWKKEIDLQHEPDLVIADMSFGAYSGTLYCNTSRGPLAVDKGQLRYPEFLKGLPANGFFNTMYEDRRGIIWLSLSDGGAWVYSNSKWIHYNYDNGLTDDNVTHFFEDAEGNIWIGTNGSGIFSYTGSLFTYYDRASGLASPSVMSMAQYKDGSIYLASSNAGLYRLGNNSNVEPVPIPAYASGVNSLQVDTFGRLWIGTQRAGLWYLDGRSTRPFVARNKVIPRNITYLYQYEGTLWISSVNGLYHLAGDSILYDPLPKAREIYATLMIGTDSMLLGTRKGVYLYRTDTRKLLPQPLLDNTTTLCLAADNRYVYIGTDDRGVVLWNRGTHQLSNIDQKRGLSCDYVYSLLRDKDGSIWVGTGCGIDKISFTDKGMKIRSFGKSDGLLGVENNANASFEDREGYLWFGTTRGLFRFNPYTSAAPEHAPRVVLQGVKLFSKDIPEQKYADSTLPFSDLPLHPVFPPSQNHLTFSFKGVFLSSPEKVRYRYQLMGADKTFTETNQNTVVYPNLPPGSYVFKVWASDAAGNWHSNVVSYPFIINAPYYTTWYFRLGIAFLLIGIFLAVVYYRNHQKELRRRWEDRLREEEQARVRQKTAEDFHDEIGNKLTRINLLATIATGKLPASSPEVKGILGQIQANVTSLYNGSKDIIWSLQPQSDYLEEIILRIRQNAEEMLQDSDIQFDFEQDTLSDTHIKLPIDYSRNMIMIFKEAITNSLKHGEATRIALKVSRQGELLVFELLDNGKGFDTSVTGKGNGLGNMNNRAKRIGGELSCDSVPGRGTLLRLLLKIY
ncbi:two component regulator with propeller domain [Taibaiella chishuiensis]|uniref:Two component regulator with propeller domain n=2 Tax=Taibaiella chishuiensis TaxID=1434707 RepID=A0A2P8D9U4_9BACT|nr:two component regulator with propeller domain [Taibaiella chishuiensis]